MAALILLSKHVCLLPGFLDRTNVLSVEIEVFKEHCTSNPSQNGERVSKAAGEVEPGLYIIVWEWVVQRCIADWRELENLFLQQKKGKLKPHLNSELCTGITCPPPPEQPRRAAPGSRDAGGGGTRAPRPGAAQPAPPRLRPAPQRPVSGHLP